MQLQTQLEKKNGENVIFSFYVKVLVFVRLRCIYIHQITQLPIWKGEKDNPVCHDVKLWRAYVMMILLA